MTKAFNIVSELDKNYTIYEYTTYEKFIDLDGENLIPVSLKLKTSSGYSVNRIRKGKYKVLDSMHNTKATATEADLL